MAFITWHESRRLSGLPQSLQRVSDTRASNAEASPYRIRLTIGNCKTIRISKAHFSWKCPPQSCKPLMKSTQGYWTKHCLTGAGMYRKGRK